VNDYERIARVIRHMQEHYEDQPCLEELARVAGLSPSHFHRLFARWAGVSPKVFLRCLTLRHARQLLAEGRDVLTTSCAVGLSGPGRLHDLCVSLEAASPGEVKSGGDGVRMDAGFAQTPLGHALIATTPRGVCHLQFLDADGEDAALNHLQQLWPAARITKADGRVRELAEQIFQRPDPNTVTSPGRAPLRVFVRGTKFQVQVWRALLSLPPGAL
jgi:AraC family transcriptional regulator of adaptative response/methylated-DNA-[protein]-cysteine methyltransferase